MPVFDYHHYVPSLRCKRGEFRALRELTPAQKQTITPLLEVQPLSDDYDPDDAQHTADVEFGRLPAAINTAAAGTICMIDGAQVDPSARMTNTAHPLFWLCDETAKLGTKMIPVTGLDRDADYNAACTNIHGALGEGIAIRLGSGEVAAMAAVRWDRKLSHR